LFKKLKILDKPGPDVPPRNRVPNIQGLVLILGVFMTFLIFFPEYLTANPLKSFFVGSIILAVVYLLDNFINIHPFVRLLIQIIAASIIYFWGGVGLDHFYI
jgi:UDP-N-acetylmuramyl pentapeptide phosphotransferase/UDP-N-acetylglucosamine-1-phosphate transferase